MEEASLCGLMVVHMKEISSKITSKVKVNTTGQTVEYIKDNGWIIKWKATEFSLGVTEEDI